MDLDKMAIAELDAELDRLDSARLQLREQTTRVRRARDAAILQDFLDHWGIDLGLYIAAKQHAAETGAPLHLVLNEARKMVRKQQRAAQTAVAGVAAIGVQATGTS